MSGLSSSQRWLLLVTVTLATVASAGCELFDRTESLPPATTPVESDAGQEEPPTTLPEESASAGSPAEQPATEPAGNSLQERLEQIRRAVEDYQRQHSVKTTSTEGTGSDAATPGGEAEIAPLPPIVDEAPAPAPTEAAPAPLGTVSIVDIRPGLAAPASEVPAAGQPEPQPPTLDALLKHYQRLAAAHPKDVEVGRTLRVLQLMAGETAASLEPVAGLSAEDQRLWRGLVWAMANARDGGEGVDPAYRSAQVLAVLDELRVDLQRQAPLELPTVEVCQRVGGFGVTTPLPAAAVRPLDRVSLYTEVRNFVSQAEGDGTYHVRLNQFLTLKERSGKIVWKKEYLNIDDRCRSVRQDFFLASTETIPAGLPAGQYLLEVTVEDVLGKKRATGTADVTVAAGG